MAIEPDMSKIEDTTQQTVETDTGNDETVSGDAGDKGSEEKTGSEESSSTSSPDTENVLESLLDELDLDSVEDVKKAIRQSRELREAIGDKDVADLLEKASTLEEYQRAWALEEELKKEESETPEETAARLKRERDEARELLNQRDTSAKERENAKKLMERFDSVVANVISSDKSLPKEYHDFAKLMLGSNSPSSIVDIGNKQAVRAMAKDGTKTIMEFVHKVITDYNAGKLKLPKIGESAPVGGDKTAGKPKKISSIADAGKRALEMLSGR